MTAAQPQPLVSVIVLNHNGLVFLEDCFDSLQKTVYPAVELLMVDNGSTDESTAFVAANYPTVRVIDSGGNIGYSAAYNQGVRAARGEIAVLLNNDVEVTPGWLDPLVAEITSDAQIAGCQPKLLHMEDRGVFEYAGAAGGFIDRLGFPYLRGRVLQHMESDQGQYDHSVDLFWASGAALAIRRDAFLHVGGLDEDFVHHMEEIDLCWRLLLHGYRLRVRADAVIYHYAGGTIKPDSFRKMYWNHRNSVFMLVKNYAAPQLLWVLPVRLLLDLVLVLKSVLTLDFKRVAAVVKAYGWLVLHPAMLVRKRRAVQHNRQVADAQILPLMRPFSLVWAYYVQRRRTYSAIQGTS